MFHSKMLLPSPWLRSPKLKQAKSSEEEQKPPALDLPEDWYQTPSIKVLLSPRVSDMNIALFVELEGRGELFSGK